MLSHPVVGPPALPPDLSIISQATTTQRNLLGRTRMNGWNYYEVIQSILEKQGLHPKAEADVAG